MLVAGGIVACAVTGHAEDEQRAGRLSDSRGEVCVRGVGEDDVSVADPNCTIRGGDVLWTDEKGNAEVELPREVRVRLADGTKAELTQLPPSGELRLWTGSVFINTRDSNEGLKVGSPVGDVQVAPHSEVRVDVDGNDAARVSVVRGSAQATADRGNPTRIADGERGYLEADRAIDGTRNFDSSDKDAFDRYEDTRNEYYAARPEPEQIPEADDIEGARELDGQGEWINDECGPEWQPNVDADWRPFSEGYWSQVPGYGYTWVDYRPWGHATSHYGRWRYSEKRNAWVWGPRKGWGPGWVRFGSNGKYYGWAPLGRNDRPVVVQKGFELNGDTIDRRSWTYVDSDHFFYGRHHRSLAAKDPGARLIGGVELGARRKEFKLVERVHEEWGVPKEHVRGIVQFPNGHSARERAVAVEGRIPAHRAKLIEAHFKVPARRDADRVAHASRIERIQTDSKARIDKGHIAHGSEAVRVVNSTSTTSTTTVSDTSTKKKKNQQDDTATEPDTPRRPNGDIFVDDDGGGGRKHRGSASAREESDARGSNSRGGNARGEKKKDRKEAKSSDDKPKREKSSSSSGSSGSDDKPKKHRGSDSSVSDSSSKPSHSTNSGSGDGSKGNRGGGSAGSGGGSGSHGSSSSSGGSASKGSGGGGSSSGGSGRGSSGGGGGGGSTYHPAPAPKPAPAPRPAPSPTYPPKKTYP